MFFLQWHIFHDVSITFFYGNMFALSMKITLKSRFVFFRHCDVFFIVSQLRYLLVQCTYAFKTLELRYIFLRSNNIWKWRDNYVSFLLVIVKYFLLRYNYVIHLFDVVTFFNDIRNRLCFGTFKLRMEITLQLCFIFVRHINVFFITSQLHYLLVQCSYVFWWC